MGYGPSWLSENRKTKDVEVTIIGTPLRFSTLDGKTNGKAHMFNRTIQDKHSHYAQVGMEDVDGGLYALIQMTEDEATACMNSKWSLTTWCMSKRGPLDESDSIQQQYQPSHILGFCQILKLTQQ